MISPLKRLIAGEAMPKGEATMEVGRPNSGPEGTLSHFVELRVAANSDAVDVVLVNAGAQQSSGALLPDGVRPDNSAPVTHSMRRDATLQAILDALEMIAMRLPPVSPPQSSEARSNPHLAIVPPVHSPLPILNGRPALTTRQKEVISLIADGVSTKWIAARLGVSIRTVEFHKHRAMKSLNISTTSALIRFACDNGLASRDWDTRRGLDGLPVVAGR